MEYSLLHSRPRQDIDDAFLCQLDLEEALPCQAGGKGVEVGAENIAHNSAALSLSKSPRAGLARMASLRSGPRSQEKDNNAQSYLVLIKRASRGLPGPGRLSPLLWPKCRFGYCPLSPFPQAIVSDGQVQHCYFHERRPGRLDGLLLNGEPMSRICGSRLA
jgi:hypothetical protein